MYYLCNLVIQIFKIHWKFISTNCSRSMNVPSLPAENSPNSPVICPTFEDIDSAQESLIKEKEQLSVQIESLESSLEDSR